MKQIIGEEELIECNLKKIGIVRDIRFQRKAEGIIDGYIAMGKEHPIRLVSLEHAFPQTVEKAILKAQNADAEDVYVIIIAPYVSPASAEVCKRLGAGYADYSGNCFVAMEGLYLSDTGHPNLFPKEEKAKNIFRSSSVVTSRILRELLADTTVTWKLQKLSAKVGCSIGRVSAIKDFLCEQNWGRMTEKGFGITDAEGLIRAWSEAYSFDKVRMVNTYSLDGVAEIERKLSVILLSEKGRGCLTGFSGGTRYAPVVRYTKVHAWVSGDSVRAVMEAAGLKEVESGANVTLYVADGDEVFQGMRTVNGSPVASPVQIYLDLMRLKGRGEEMAEAILTKEIIR